MTIQLSTRESAKPVVLSGVQPSGDLHLGNYLGAIRNWVVDQTKYQNFFCVVDLHAITDNYKPATLADETLEVAALYLACGVDLQHSSIFVQSHVPAHAQLCWILNCTTPISWLQRMVQYKEKSTKRGKDVSIGLLDYPVLMTADIILYQADLVPVGEDQKQHLELARDIAIRFNRLFGNDQPIFKVPEPLIRDSGARIMSLTDGSKKMSKSDPTDYSRINLLDPPDLVRRKVQRCRTDSRTGLSFDDSDRPESTNLIGIYHALSGKDKQVVVDECRSMSFSTFKPLLTEVLIETLRPIQKRYEEITRDKNYLASILLEGATAANEVANRTLQAAMDGIGFVRQGHSASTGLGSEGLYGDGMT